VELSLLRIQQVGILSLEGIRAGHGLGLTQRNRTPIFFTNIKFIRIRRHLREFPYGVEAALPAEAAPFPDTFYLLT